MCHSQPSQTQPLQLLRHRLLDHSSHSSSTSEKNLFLGINIAIVAILLLSILGYCYFFRNRFDDIIRRQLELNDQVLEQNIRHQQSERELETATRRRQQQERDNDITNNAVGDDNDENNESIEQRRALLVESFQRNKVTMVVTEEDFCYDASERHMSMPDDDDDNNEEIVIQKISTTVNENTEPTMGDVTNEDVSLSSSIVKSTVLQRKNQNESLEEAEVRYIWVGGHRNDSSSSSATSLSQQRSRRRLVPNCCAICLGPYEVNETVVWSCCTRGSITNHTTTASKTITGCQHVFHYDCMIDWLIKVQDGTPCPCCRQEFTDLPLLPRRNKFATNPTNRFQQPVRYRNFDLSLLSFR